MAELANHIHVDRGEDGAPRITIDGQVMPWFTAGIVVPPPSLDESPTITVTLLAEKVTMVNESQPAPRVRIEVEPGRWRCRHPGCLGYHSTANEACC